MPSEHRHQWGRVVFIGGLAVRHCEKDCPATQAQEGDRWVRVDRPAEEPIPEPIFWITSTPKGDVEANRSRRLIDGESQEGTQMTEKRWLCERDGDVLMLNMHSYRLLMCVGMAMGFALGLGASVLAWIVIVVVFG